LQEKEEEMKGKAEMQVEKFKVKRKE